ncbi:MAG: YqgE/AlgH family protein, partial [Actinomycetota bacterium]
RPVADLAGDVESVRLFSGYAGWGPGQLDGELEAEGWLVVDADPDDVRSADAEALWTEVLARQPDPALRRLALYPPDVNLN